MQLTSANESKKTYNKEYIVLHIDPDNIEDYLTIINQYNGNYIYKLKKSKKIYNVFNNFKLNIDDYIELGNYIIYDTNDKLANSQASYNLYNNLLKDLI